MKKLAITVFAILAGTGFAMAEDAGCEAFKWPVTREQALFAAAPATPSGTPLAIGAAVDLALVPVEKAGFAVPPEHAPGEGTFGAVTSLAVPPDGAIQISLSGEAWIDVIQNGKAVKSSDYSGVKTCQGIRKSMRFKLGAGPTTVQFSGSKKETLKVAVLTPE